MNLKSLLFLSFVTCAVVNAGSSFAAEPQPQHKCPPNAKCMSDTIEVLKKYELVGTCIDESAVDKKQKDGKKPGWFQKPKLNLELYLVYNKKKGTYEVVADARLKGPSLEELRISPPPGKPVPEEMLDGKPVFTARLSAEPTDDSAEVTLLEKGSGAADGKIKLSLKKDGQIVQPWGDIFVKAPSEALLYDAYLRYFAGEKDEPTFVELKCALIPSLVGKIAGF